MKLLFLFSLLVMNIFSTDQSKTDQSSSTILEGVVVSKETNRPIPKAYLFVVKGEEETITGSNGKFVITTWQKLPVTITVEHPEFKKVKVEVKGQGNAHIIKLEQK